MKISHAKECIKEVIRKKKGVTALISERGVGKTSAYRQCAEELGIGYQALYAAALEGPDFMGLPDRDSLSGITRYLAPQFLPTIQAVEEGLFPEKGLLVLEEINRVPSDTVSVLYPLLLEGRINQHSLAPGWHLGVTLNPDKMNYSVNALDDALIDRFISIEINPNLDDYISYSYKTESHDGVIAFLQACPDMLLITQIRSESDPLLKHPTPRGWTGVQKLLRDCDLNDELLQQMTAGLVGPEAAASFFGFMRQNQLAIPGAEETLMDFRSQKSKYEALIEDSRLDILQMVLKRIVLCLKNQKEHYRNLQELLVLLPEEWALLFFKQLAVHRPDDFESVSRQIPLFDDLSELLIQTMTDGAISG